MLEAQKQNLSHLLGKPSCPVDYCLSILAGNYPTVQKKEAMSSIGRRRDRRYKPIFFEYAYHENPEIAMQAILGLLSFKKDSDVADFLFTLSNHSNDMVRDMVNVEIANQSKPEAEKKQTDHTESPHWLKNAIIQDDVLEILDRVDDESIHLTFTSPPYYNARDYSIYKNYDEYLGFLEEVFKKVHRVTKEGRFFVLNTSPVIVPRAGRKYSSRRYAVPFDVHARLTDMGWEFIDDIVWEKPEKSAKNRVSGFNVNRKPLTYKPNPCVEYVMVYRKKSSRLIDWNLKQYSDEQMEGSLVDDHFNRSNVWKIAPTASKLHTAVFPIELCRQVIKLYSFKGDLVFDPFAGSGTTGKAASELNRYFLLVELNEKYVEVIKSALAQQNLILSGQTNEYQKNISKY